MRCLLGVGRGASQQTGREEGGKPLLRLAADRFHVSYPDDSRERLTRSLECKNAIRCGPVAWLHDEIVLEVRDDRAELAAEILKQAMIDGFIETFPGAPIDGLKSGRTIGVSWAEEG